jgi:ParB-like chromosome segregation protein Spo0J
MTDPIDKIEWVHAGTLTANNYNPNYVVGPELRLLEHSLLSTGWIQPILITEDNEIIDGFHRWKLSTDSKKIHARWGGLVPVARLPISRAEAMGMTVRINRAKGQHIAIRMADMVKEMIDDHGLTPKEVAHEIGGNVAEVELLYDNSLFKSMDLKNYKYSQEWVPYDDRDPGGASNADAGKG